MSKIRAVILDFDGVLAESNEEKEAAFEELFSLYPEHFDSMRAFHIEHLHRPRRVKFAHYVEHIMQQPGNGELVDRMAAEFSALVADRVINCPEVPGASDFLREFSQRLPLYISSVTPQIELEKIVEGRGINPYIKEAFGDPPHAKDEAVQVILRREELAPHQVVFVGDSNSDYLVAQKGGLVFLGRDSGQPFPDADLSLFADLHGVADSLRSLL